MKQWITATLCVLCLPLWSAPPRTVLWSWERPDDLRFLNSPEVGVAFLAGSVFLRGSETVTHLRQQPLLTSPQTPLIAVVRIETDPRHPPTLTATQRDTTIQLVRQAAKAAKARSVQIDFDARPSERTFYRLLLQQLRRELDPDIFLSMTALASWCERGSWMTGLPVDEAVPMLFRMGPEGRTVFYALTHGRDFPAAACRGSAGVSLDEDRPPLIRERRQYWFNPRPWTAESVKAVLSEGKSLP